MDVDGKSYLVTAKHFANCISDEGVFQIQHDNQWKDLKVKLVAHAAGEIDISVFAPPFRLALPGIPLEADMGGLSYGQDVFFLGYPYGFFGELGALNHNFPMPFVKRALVSCVEQDPSGVTRVFLDGHNNPGFSGGPVVFQKSGSKEFKIAAVISGYKAVNEPVFKEATPLPFTVRYNTGIIISYSVQHALTLVRNNAIGPKIVA